MFNPSEFIPAISSDTYARDALRVLERGLTIYRARGSVVYSYTNTGLSPRIQPLQYGSSYNCIKRPLRNK